MTPSIDPSRSGIDNAPMEARIARIETHVEHLNANVADLRVASTRLDAKIDDVYRRLDAKIDDFYRRLDARIDAVEQRLEAKLDAVEQRLEMKIDRLAAKVDRHFVILGGMFVSLGIGMAGLMAKGFHWL